MDMEGNTGLVDTMDQEIRGLAIDPTLSYTVIYTDGVEDEEVFPDQRFAAEAGKATPDFRGTPARKGYTFTGWTPEVAETVTAHATYTATWEGQLLPDPSGCPGRQGQPGELDRDLRPGCWRAARSDP